MPIILPEPGKPVVEREINPGKLLLYGPRKLGKTSFLDTLPRGEALTLDYERGTVFLTDPMSIPVNSVPALYETRDAIIQKAMGLPKVNGKAPFPYKWVAHDTITSLEELVEKHATAIYNKEMKGSKDFKEVESVEDLAWGAGWGKIRRGVIKAVNDIGAVCRYQIIVAHLKETEIDKEGLVVSSKDISLHNKLRDIIASRVDAIGYMKWVGKELMISFTAAGESKGGARCPHLTNVVIPADWSLIYLNEGLESKPFVAKK